MNWSNLKNNQCPKCKSALEANARYHKCTNVRCDFMCSVQKFNMIVNDLYRPKRYRIGQYEEENLSALNNL